MNPLQPVEGSGIDPYADCRNAIRAVEIAEERGFPILAVARAAGKSVSEVLAALKASSQETLDVFGDNTRPEFRASIPEFDTLAFRLWLCGKMGAM